MNSKLEWIAISNGPWSKRRKHQAVVWNNLLVLLGGFDGESALDLNDVWSFDGESWSLVTEHASWSGRDGHCAVVLNGSIFVIGGTDDPYCCQSDVWRSDDGGKTWIEVRNTSEWPERWQHACCVHKDHIYVAGGWGGNYLNDLWRSADGKTWVKACENCPWKPRMFHSCISFNDAIYIIGGHDGRIQLNDVWASNDGGVTWIQVCSSAEWDRRQGHVTVALDGFVYVMGGFGGSTRYNDLWRSKDCAHWTLIHRECQWSPRQGHACTAYKGALMLIGGFDVSGYCNDMYGYQVTSSSINIPTSTVKLEESSGKVITVTLNCALDMIAKLKQKRREREKVIQLMMNAVGLVMSAVNFKCRSSASKPFYMSSHTTSRPSSARQISGDRISGTSNIQVPVLSRHHSGSDQAEWCIGMMTARSGFDDDSDDDIDTTNSHAGARGSPLRENFKDVRNASTKSLSRISSDHDLRMHFWNSLPTSSPVTSRKQSLAEPESPRSRNMSSSSVRFGLARLVASEKNEDEDSPFSDHSEESVSGDEADGIEEQFSSAFLRECMQDQRKVMTNLQRKIRLAAESGDVSSMDTLVGERTEIATASRQLAKRLLKHITIVQDIQHQRHLHLSEIFRRLEKFSKAYVMNSFDVGIDEPLEPVQCTWSEWTKIVAQCSSAVNAVKIDEANTAIVNFTEGMKILGKVCQSISEWVDKSIIENVDEITELGISSRFSSAVDMLSIASVPSPFPHEEGLMMEYQAVHDALDVKRMAVKSTIDVEIGEIVSTQESTRNLLELTLEKGCALVRGLLSQNRLDTMEIAAMKDEVREWYEKLKQIQDIKSLKQKCQEILQQNSFHEDKLIKLEDERIDLKSNLEKSLVRRPGRASPRMGITSFFTQNEDIKDSEELKAMVAIAEQKVRDLRRDIRKWYREIRTYAMDVAPELFLNLPDLRSHGSVLGDGGFAESANIPKRRIDEYENVRPLTTSGDEEESSGKAVNFSGRHLLYAATYDKEDVVLKGFVMHDSEQRKGLEREITILGRLKCDCIIAPRAIVEGSASLDTNLQVTVFIEYPFYRGGNLSLWLREARKPWELQSVARQVLYGLNYLHDHGVIHKDIKSSNVLLHEDGRAVLTDFELSKQVSIIDDDVTSAGGAAGTKGFMAPEVEAGQPAVFASDMYSFGVLLFYMHFPTKMNNIVPGHVRIPANGDSELTDLVTRLLELAPIQRPTAASALMHPYFRTTFVERLLQEGEIVEQDRKLEAVRSMLHRCRSENVTNVEKCTIRRANMVEDVLTYFREMLLERIKFSLKVIFTGEPGIDEGGLLTEMFSVFYDRVFQGEGGLFESAESVGENDEGVKKPIIGVVLPTSADPSVDLLLNLKAFGRAMVKTLYEGRRIGSRLCPSVFKFITGTSPNMRDLQIYDPQTARSLQWTLATVGVEDVGLNFESVGMPDLGPVDDTNKATFVMMKINSILVETRKPQLIAIKEGFAEAMAALSEEAAPFLKLLSHADWRVMLCGEAAINGHQIVSCLKFFGFPRKSTVPEWLKEILISSSDDHLRQFLVFVTGSPSLPSVQSQSPDERLEITVRCQPRSGALPIAHTCFFQLDIPDYRSKEVFQQKLIYAIQNVNTFEIV